MRLQKPKIYNGSYSQIGNLYKRSKYPKICHSNFFNSCEANCLIWSRTSSRTGNSMFELDQPCQTFIISKRETLRTVYCSLPSSTEKSKISLSTSILEMITTYMLMIFVYPPNQNKCRQQSINCKKKTTNGQS